MFFGGKRVARRDSTGNIYYYAEDFIGSSRVITQSNGTLCSDADFLPFGQEVDFTSACGQNYKLEGKERDLETGNDNFGARYYRSALGRWMSPDWSAIPAPVPYANLVNPQTLNLYAMTSDDPETFADLDGHQGGIQAGNGSIPDWLADGQSGCGTTGDSAIDCGTGIDLSLFADLFASAPPPPTPPPGTAPPVSPAQAAQQQKKGVVQKVKAWAKAHPKTTKAIVTTVIVVTAISGAADEGASEAAIPEEEAAGAALESGTEAGEAGQAGEGAGSKAAADLKSIEKAQQRVRSGSDAGRRIIDSIEKSAQELKNMLRKPYDPTDWE